MANNALGGGVASPTNNLKTYNGNLVQLTIGGATVAAGQSATVQRNYALTAVSGIGDNRPVEWVPGLSQITVSVSQMLLRANTLAKQGVVPTRSVNQVLAGNTFDIVITDIASGTILEHITGATLESDSLTVNKHTPLEFSATFYGIDSLHAS